MANKDVSIAVCGGIVGILLGAGSLLSIQDASLHASAVDTVSLREPANYQLMRRRAVRENLLKPDNGSAQTIQQEGPSTESEPVESDVQAEASDCDTARRVVGQMAVAIDRTVPKNQEMTEINSGLNRALAQILMSYCAGERHETQTPAVEDSTVETEESVKPARQDNDCWRFAKNSPRRAQCEGNQNKGTGYVPAR